jgi:hypothetical protein
MTYTTCVICDKTYRYTYRPRKSGICGTCRRKIMEEQEWPLISFVKDVVEVKLDHFTIIGLKLIIYVQLVQEGSEKEDSV